MIKNILYFISTILLIGCISKEVQIPDDIIDADTFTDIMIDVQIAEGMTSHNRTNRRNKTEEQGFDPYISIFKKHNVEADEFQRTYDFYSHHPDLMEGIYEQVLDSLSKLEAEVKQRFTKEERTRTDSIRNANQRKSDSIRGIVRPIQTQKK